MKIIGLLGHVHDHVLLLTDVILKMKGKIKTTQPTKLSVRLVKFITRFQKSVMAFDCICRMNRQRMDKFTVVIIVNKINWSILFMYIL